MSEWYYKNMEEEVGPISPKELVEKVREERVTGTRTTGIVFQVWQES